jgi:hypothetical protein
MKNRYLFVNDTIEIVLKLKVLPILSSFQHLSRETDNS